MRFSNTGCTPSFAPLAGMQGNFLFIVSCFAQDLGLSGCSCGLLLTEQRLDVQRRRGLLISCARRVVYKSHLDGVSTREGSSVLNVKVFSAEILQKEGKV